MNINRFGNGRTRRTWLALLIIVAMMTSMFSAVAEVVSDGLFEVAEEETFELQAEAGESKASDESDDSADDGAGDDDGAADDDGADDGDGAPAAEAESEDGSDGETSGEEKPGDETPGEEKPGDESGDQDPEGPGESDGESGEPTKEPDADASPEPTADPSESPTVDPSASPTVDPSASPLAESADAQDATITGFAELEKKEYPINGKPPYEVVAGAAQFPATLKATLGDGTEVSVPVQWYCADYDKAEYGAFTFSSMLDTTEYVLGEGVVMPKIILVVTVITKITPPKKTEYVWGDKPAETAAAAAEKLGLPTTLKVTLTGIDSDEKALPVEWTCSDYESRKSGEFIFVSEFIGSGFYLASGVEMPEVTLRVVATDEFTFVENEDKTLTITGWKGEGTLLIVPDKIGESYVSGIADNAFKGHDKITGAMLPDGLVKLGDGVFAGCTALSLVMLPDSLRSVGKDIFDTPNAITDLVLIVNDRTTLRSDDTFEHVDKMLEGEDKIETVQLPLGITDILVENVGILTVATDYTVKPEHMIAVDADAELIVGSEVKLINLGDIHVYGKVTNEGTVYGCATTSKMTPGDAIAGYITEHSFDANNVCVICGALKPEAISLNDSKIVIAPIENQIYTGNEIRPDVVITYDKDYKLVRDTDFTAAYENNIEKGTAKIVLTGKGRFTDTRTIGFQIVEAGDKTDRAVKITLKSGHNPTKVYDKTRNVTLKSSDFSISNVAEGDTVKISQITAAYDTAAVGDRTVSVSFKITQTSELYNYKVSDITIDGTITKKPLNITPTADQTKVYGTANPSYYKGKVSGLLTGDTITGRLSRESGEKVGKYKITQGTITAGDNYEVVVAEEYFTITPKSINASDVGLAAIGNQKYTGSAIQPSITLKYGDNTLVQGTDFDVTFSKNTDAGTATATITGKGNYTDTRTTTFRIIKVNNNSSNGSSNSSSSTTTPEPDDPTAEETEEPEDTEPTATPAPEDLGVLELGDPTQTDTTYIGRILFESDSNEARPFYRGEDKVFSTEEVPVGEEPVEQRILYIQARPEVDDTVDLEDGDVTWVTLPEDETRNSYEASQLRLTPEQVFLLTQAGYVEIVYKLESAEFHIGLEELTKEIDSPDAEDDEAYVDEEDWQENVQIVDDDEDLDDGSDEGVELEDGNVDAPVEEAGDVNTYKEQIAVDYYIFTIEQVKEDIITDRESLALEGMETIIPMYRLDIEAVVGELEDNTPDPNSEEEDEEATFTSGGLNVEEPKPEPTFYPMLGVLEKTHFRIAPQKEVNPVSPAVIGESEQPEYPSTLHELSHVKAAELQALALDQDAQQMYVLGDPDITDDASVVLEAVEITNDAETTYDYFKPVQSAEEQNVPYLYFHPSEEGTFAVVKALPEDETSAPADTSVGTPGEQAAPTATPEPTEAPLIEDPDPKYAYSRRSNEGNQYWLVNTQDKTVEYYREDTGEYMIGDYVGSLMSGMNLTFRDPLKTVLVKLKFQQTYKFSLMEDEGKELLMEQDDIANVEAVMAQHRK